MLSDARRSRARGEAAAGSRLMFPFPLHPSVLKPDLNLALGETKRVRDLDASTAGQVAVVVEFLFQFERLEPSVRRSGALRVVHVELSDRAVWVGGSGGSGGATRRCVQ